MHINFFNPPEHSHLWASFSKYGLLPISAKQKAQGGMGENFLFLFEYQKRCPPNNHAENTILCLSPSLVALLEFNTTFLVCVVLWG